MYAVRKPRLCLQVSYDMPRNKQRDERHKHQYIDRHHYPRMLAYVCTKFFRQNNIAPIKETPKQHIHTEDKKKSFNL